ncbi:unnamed protein product [Linum tenue]|uniref:Uncharacterized protein n=1 Tax=Linum tenue TaxID=586396 RepID=A0AAV0KM86_9ROSI|nr:unnamed protein product [Linum tenue]
MIMMFSWWMKTSVVTWRSCSTIIKLLNDVNVANGEDGEPHLVLDDFNVANDDDCLPQPIEHVEEENVGIPMENVAEANNLGALSTVVPEVMST